jgi:hypothetical protein
MLDTGCWIAAEFYLFFIQLKGIENNDYYLNKLSDKAECGFSSASIMNVQQRPFQKLRIDLPGTLAVSAGH